MLSSVQAKIKASTSATLVITLFNPDTHPTTRTIGCIENNFFQKIIFLRCDYYVECQYKTQENIRFLISTLVTVSKMAFYILQRCSAQNTKGKIGILVFLDFF